MILPELSLSRKGEEERDGRLPGPDSLQTHLGPDPARHYRVLTKVPSGPGKGSAGAELKDGEGEYTRRSG